MDAQFKQDLADWGVDLEDALARFMGNEALMEQFLQKFLNDPNMGLLKEALDAKDAEAAFKACHTLKGVAGNLSLNGFIEPVKALTEVLRAGSLDGAEELYDSIRPSYDSLIAIIQKYETA